MFGTYRLLLACLVALSHFGLVIGGFNPGQWAVLAFYLLSGYLMEPQCHKLAPQGQWHRFYLDRLLRIYPLYFVVLVLTSFLVKPSAGTFGLNAALFPLNYHTLTGTSVIVGPAWSLACEAHFYLLVPLFALASLPVIRGLALASVGLFAISPVLPQSTFWAYIGLPGVLFAFLSGILVQRKDHGFLKTLWIIVALLLGFFLLTKIRHWNLPTGIHINVCLGYLAAVPIVCRLCRRSPKVGWDQKLGLLSYPLFLVHEPVREWVVNHLILGRGVNFNLHPVLSTIPLLLASLVVAAVLVFVVEKPFDRIRYRLRGRATVGR